MESNHIAFSCALTTPELQKRKATIINQLKLILIEREELPDGYSYKFKNTDEVIDILANFVKIERQCCSFFDFNLVVRNNQSAELRITGELGVKEFLRIELEL